MFLLLFLNQKARKQKRGQPKLQETGKIFHIVASNVLKKRAEVNQSLCYEADYCQEYNPNEDVSFQARILELELENKSFKETIQQLNDALNA